MAFGNCAAIPIIRPTYVIYLLDQEVPKKPVECIFSFLSFQKGNDLAQKKWLLVKIYDNFESLILVLTPF